MSVALLLLLILPFPVQDDPDAEYREQYAKYTEIMEIADPVARGQAFLDFIEAGHDERLLGSLLNGVQEALAELAQAQNYNQAYTLADRWSALRDDPQPVALALQAAMASENHQQIVNYGEKFYAMNPDPQVALILAQSYFALGNDAKTIEHMANLPISETWPIVYALSGKHAAAEEWSEAARYARTLQSGFTAAPAGVNAQQWAEMRLYFQDTIARDHYEAGRYQDAITGYREVLQMDSRSDKAYYYIADSQMKTNQIAASMDNFANAYVLSGNYSSNAYSMLEAIYRANTGGSLDGLDRVINQARGRVGP